MTQNYSNTKTDNVIIRNVTQKDIPKIIKLQKESFADMALYGMIWPKSFLESHIDIFPEGQFCVEIDGKIIGSASSLIISLKTEYMDHDWYSITGSGLFTNHDYNGDSLYGADLSVHPKFWRKGIGTMLYNARKNLAMKLNLRRIISGGRLYNYCKYHHMMSAIEYAEKVVKNEITDPVLSFQLNNGFHFIKILNDYLYDKRSLNHASFIEWLNPKYNGPYNQ